MIKWEYFTLIVQLGGVNSGQGDEALNKLGDQGWKCVGFTRECDRFDYLLRRRQHTSLNESLVDHPPR